MTQLDQYLINYFQLSHDQCKAIANLFYKQNLAKGQFIGIANKPCEQLSFIQKGCARFYVQTEHKEVLNGFLEKVIL